MTVWMFYTSESYMYFRGGDTVKNQMMLYALTNKKELAKRFKDTRNMKVFSERIVEMSGERYIEIVRDNRQAVLEESSLISYTKYPDMRGGRVKIKDVKLVTTFLEKASIDDDCYEFDIMQKSECNLVNPYIFSKKLMASLDILQYTFYYVMQCALCDKETPHGLPTYETVPVPNISIDELQYFINVYGHLLNPKTK